jgi:murein DD-endopeptidase MepM/ murein hydrolase activator NlpD
MTDTTPTPDVAPDAQPAPDDGKDWKAEARKWEARSKENATAARRLAELEEASKSDLQKALERAEAAERRATEYELTAARAEVASQAGIPADVLRGATREELEAHAASLKAVLDAQTAPRGPVVTNPGGTPTTTGGDEHEFVTNLFGN